jgi:uncharacterized pyridoxamine 5'-phosphate oxidase family protein
MQKLYEVTNSKKPGHFYKLKKNPPGFKFCGLKRQHVGENRASGSPLQ